ncbi:hypothetical protein VTO42DRAFT_4983 [Malbranchea cinnamomea]
MSQQQNAPDLASNQASQSPTVPITATTQSPSKRDSADSRTVSRSGTENATPDSNRLQRPVSADHGSSSSATPSRSIAVQAILNPADVSLETCSRQNSKEPIESPTPASISPSIHPQGSPSPVIRPPSDPLLHFDRPGLSPRVQSRPLLTPRSPGRAASFGGRSNPIPGTINVTQSPFIQSPGSRSFSAKETVRLNTESAIATAPSRFQYETGRVRSASFFAEHRQGPVGSRPHSQDTSPSTPQSGYSPFSQTPPSSRPSYVQQPPPRPPPPFSHNLPPPPIGPPIGELNRPPLLPEAGSLHTGGEMGYPQMPLHHIPIEPPTLIPVTIDMESGSRKADDKRRKNSYASKKFRERKKAGEAEQLQRLERQAEEIKILTEERDYYRAERDFFRELVAGTPGLSIPSRPPSPRLRRRAPEAPPQTQQEQNPPRSGENRENYGRNVRPRLGSAPSSVSFQSSSSLGPTNHAQYSLGHAPSWTGPGNGTQQPASAPPPSLPLPAQSQAPPAPPPLPPPASNPPAHPYLAREAALPPRSQTS